MVKISEIEDAMSSGIDFSPYYDRTEDKVVILSEYDSIKVEEDLRKLIESDESDRFLYISSGRGSTCDWEDMAAFIRTVKDDSKRERLSEAIIGKGAFRRFRIAADRCGLLDDWYSFRDGLLEERARAWCEFNGVQLQD